MTSPSPFRVAVLPCWKNHGHQHEYDTLLRAAGADFTVLEESREALDALFSSLDDFDLLLAPPLFHYDQGRQRDPDWRRRHPFAGRPRHRLRPLGRHTGADLLLHV